ncbi:hypothetical protein TTHERM_00149350 (macronuclear) [Tetrahymena thermophila SB210]|uniref:RAP domain protein n=1 Tax=Tetrahymena thermophila (strain SB210) TaxID=312017 RepID=I7M9C5_TETTS|nr:hypothetical protein TTHERM_00149350 [Tetrahymena thermophila SB210]EAS01325.2 hypothetical protein TTHERM_00149350 [Tetrahymena thermophila SB210]|eukprot:XP_001021570.2 hypothetical protein TTHERM_00149350 [Tetrahymena thermophila SB210]
MNKIHFYYTSMHSIKNLAKSTQLQLRYKPTLQPFSSRSFTFNPLFAFSKIDMIGSENLNKSSKIEGNISRQVQNAYSMKNLLEIYLQIQDQITPFNFYFIAREMQTRFYSEDPKTLQKNHIFQKLIQYIESNIEKMPPYTQVEVLTLIRKCYQNGHLNENLTKKLAKQIDQLLQQSCERKNNNINPKLISQAHLDLVNLDICQEYWIEQLKIKLHDPNQLPYFTNQTIYNIFKSTEQFCKKKHSDFFYQLSVKSIPLIEQFDLDRLCNIFMLIAQLQLQFNTSHFRNPQALQVIKDEIMKKIDQNFTIRNGMYIIQAYTKAPHTLDNLLLQNVLKQMTIYLQNQQMNTRQIMQFLNYTSQLREGFKLSKTQIQQAYNLIIKQLRLKKDITPSLCLEVLTFMFDVDHNDDQILELIDNILRNQKQLGFTMLTKILQYMLKLKYDCSYLRKQLSGTFNIDVDQNFQKNLELIFIFNYEIKSNPNDHLQYKASVEKLTQNICNQIKNYESVALFLYYLDTYGKNYVAQKSEPFRIINKQFYEVYSQIYDQLNNNQKSYSLLNVCNWNIFDDQWQNFIMSKAQDLNDKELLSWIISKYIQDQNKIYLKLDLILKMCYYSKFDKNELFQLKVKAILNTPYLSIINKKGTPHPLLQKVFEQIDLKALNIKEQKVSFSMLIKSQRVFELSKIPSCFFVEAIMKLLEQTTTEDILADKQFQLTEVSQFLIQYDTELSELGQLNELNKKIISIKQLLDQQFEESNQNFGLVYLLKYLETTAWIYEKQIMTIQKDEIQFLSQKLLEKLQNIQLQNQTNQTLSSILLLAILQTKQIINLDILNQQFLLDLFTKSLNSLSVQGFVSYLEGMKMLRFFKQQQIQNNLNDGNQPNEEMEESDKKSLLNKYFRQIEYFYISKDAGKLPYVVTEFMIFFSTFKKFYSQPQVYNKLLQDILNLFNRFKISNLQEILKHIANVKLHHPQVLSLIYQHFDQNMLHYRSSFQDMLWNFALLGYVHQNKDSILLDKSQAYSSSSDEEFNDDKGQYISVIDKCFKLYGHYKIYYQYKMIWVMIFYDLQNQNKECFLQLLNEQFSQVTSEKHNLQFSSISFILDIVSHCVLYQPDIFEKLTQPKEKIIEASQNLLQIINNQNKNNQQTTNKQLIQDLVKQEKDFECKQDYLFEEYLLTADIYIPETKTIVLLEQDQFVNYDQQTLSGQGQLRKRFFEKLIEKLNSNNQQEQNKPYKLVSLNSWKLKNVGEKKEDQINYLKKHNIFV